MADRRYVSIKSLQKGMRLDQDVLDKSGRGLIKRGTILDEYVIKSMLRSGVTGVYIGGEDEIKSDIFFDEAEAFTLVKNEEHEISPETMKVIEENTVPDRAKVSLSESVKKRMEEGIRFMYANAESEEFVNTTNTLTWELMQAIISNDAVAVDVDALKVCDEYTFKHSVDVATIGMIIARQYGLSEGQVYEVGLAGLLHDIGKSKIPNEILNKPGRLEEAEFAIMKQHSLYGYRLLENKSDIPRSVKLAVLQHHEKLNGNGYPLGAPNDQICLYAKILAIADIFDALVTDRPYKSAFSKREAVEMIMAMTDELDIEAMRSFLGAIILYPVHSTVHLSNGEDARVVSNDPLCVLRPTVVSLKTGTVYDLARDIKCASLVIM